MAKTGSKCGDSPPDGVAARPVKRPAGRVGVTLRRTLCRAAVLWAVAVPAIASAGSLLDAPAARPAAFEPAAALLAAPADPAATRDVPESRLLDAAANGAAAANVATTANGVTAVGADAGASLVPLPPALGASIALLGLLVMARVHRFRRAGAPG